MTTPIFPTIFRPSINYSYTHTGNNLFNVGVAGGMSRAGVRYCTEKVPFSMSFIVSSPLYMQVFNDWYFNIVEQGTKKFTMDIDATGIKESHVCIIVPGSITVTGNNPFVIDMQIEAEKIAAPFEGELYKMISDGYSNLGEYFSRIEQFANFDIL